MTTPQLLCGDCLEELGHLPDASIDAIVTDPPFAFAGGLSNGFSSRADSQFFVFWLTAVFRELYRVSAPHAPWFLWADWRSPAIYSMALEKAAPDYHDQRWVSQILIHDREMVGMGTPFRNQTDWIALIRGKKTDFGTRVPTNQPNIIRDYWYYGKHDHHPAEKSLAVARSLVCWAAAPGAVVLDPFMGSGTTGLAALAEGRRFVGIEQDPEHYETAKGRLAGLVTVGAPTISPEAEPASISLRPRSLALFDHQPERSTP